MTKIIKYFLIAVVVFLCVGFYHNSIKATPQRAQMMMGVQKNPRTQNQITRDYYNNHQHYGSHISNAFTRDIHTGFHVIF